MSREVEDDKAVDTIVNRYCPNSGKAVQKDSLTEYRGLVVGFCNPHCRDVFRCVVSCSPTRRKR